MDDDFKVGELVEFTGHDRSVIVGVMTEPACPEWAQIMGAPSVKVFVGRVVSGKNYDLPVGEVEEFVTLNFRRVSGVADE